MLFSLIGILIENDKKVFTCLRNINSYVGTSFTCFPPLCVLIIDLLIMLELTQTFKGLFLLEIGQDATFKAV